MESASQKINRLLVAANKMQNCCTWEIYDSMFELWSKEAGVDWSSFDNKEKQFIMKQQFIMR